MRKVLFIAATHGNEQASVDVMQKIEKAYPKAEYGYDWITGNPEAYKRNQRFVEQDLNRSAPGDMNSQVYEQKRAAEIIELSKSYDAVIDLHWTASHCEIVTIIPNPTEQNIELAKSIGLKRNVTWYSQSSEIAGPLVQHIEAPAIEIECGPIDSPVVVAKLYKIIETFLQANIRNKPVKSSYTPEFYDVYSKLLGSHDPLLEDFVSATRNSDTFYPFLAGNNYSGITCYKLKKIDSAQIRVRQPNERATATKTTA